MLSCSDWSNLHILPTMVKVHVHLKCKHVIYLFKVHSNVKCHINNHAMYIKSTCIKKQIADRTKFIACVYNLFCILVIRVWKLNLLITLPTYFSEHRYLINFLQQEFCSVLPNILRHWGTFVWSFWIGWVFCTQESSINCLCH